MRQSGASLVSVLVATALVGVIAAAIATFSVNGIRSTKRTELAGEREAIRNALMGGLDCAKTMGAKVGAANVGTSFANCATLKPTNAQGTVLTGAANKLGAFTVTTTCTALGLRVVLTRPDGAGGFLKDPLHANLRYGPTHPQALLFGDGTDLCQDYVQGMQKKKVFSGSAQVFWVNGATNSPVTRVSFPESCRNPIVVTQVMDDSIACSTTAAPFRLAGCNHTPGTTSQDLLSRVSGVSASGFDVSESTHSAVCANVAGSAPLGTPCAGVSRPYSVSYVATCDP